MEKKAKTERKVNKMKRKALVILNGEKLKEIFSLDYINTYIIIAVLIVYLAIPNIGDFLALLRIQLLRLHLLFYLQKA